MKILHTSDWHLGAYVGPQCDDPYKRMENTIKFLDKIVETARQDKPDIILIAGDIFHQAKVWAERALTEVRVAAKYINLLSQFAPVAVLYGTPNHDGEGQFITLQEMTPGIKYFTEPGIKPILTKNGMIQVAGLPGLDKGHFRAQYPGMSAEEENQLFTQLLDSCVQGLSAQVDQSIPSVLMAHHTVVGCELDNGQHVFQANEVVLSEQTLNNSAFGLVCLGHIHRAQCVGEPTIKPIFYAGSIDATNFNEEDHIKGFWIHDTDHPINPKFVEMPAREFSTYFYDQEIMSHIAAGENLFGGNALHDQVVRILYTCDSDTEKALDKKKLERDLYAAGAYYVHEIRPEKIEASVNRERLNEKLTVWDCLRRYLTEKKIEDMREILLDADTIVSKIEASQPTGGQTGLFLPLEISVRNYRSYAEETLSFQDIFFAMVNGKNGIGKSSLFMDAISDCLYEQLREGDKADRAAWVKNGEKSGSISFTFQLGNDTYRVTRTRQRSGKGTLAVAKLEGLGNGISYNTDFPLNWQDVGCERMDETQDKIVQLLGMDADTFRSCVLIMQDQYGRFMEAKPEDRMSVLASLLGLGVYEQLEDETKKLLQEVNRELKTSKEAAAALEDEVNQADTLQQDLDSKHNDLKSNEAILIMLRQQKEEATAKVASLVQVRQESARLLREASDNETKAREKNSKLDNLTKNSTTTKAFLQDESFLIQKHNELQETKDRILSMDGTVKLVADKLLQVDRLGKELKELLLEKSKLEMDVKNIQSRLQEYHSFSAQVKKLEGVEEELQHQEEKRSKWDECIRKLTELDNKKSQLENTIRMFENQAAIIKNANCIDIEHAQCGFLKAAKEAAEKVVSLGTDKVLIINEIEAVTAEKDVIQYDAVIHAEVKADLEKYRKLNQQLAMLDGDKKLIDVHVLRLAGITKRIDVDNSDISSITAEAENLQLQVEDYNSLQVKVIELEQHEKKWQQLPAAKQYLESVIPQMEDLSKEIEQLNNEAKAGIDKAAELDRQVHDGQKYEDELQLANSQILTYEPMVSSLNRQIGSLEEKLEILKGKQITLDGLKNWIEQLAAKASRLQVLSEAFSQDGIPHQIIRDIIPELEAAANEILGQMTGGRMRLEFRTEKNLKSNKGKEVATLDIVIIDIDNGELPYLSRSGGQKVRAALAVSFALAIVKASRVGLQLGMMFVDEPPFLDADGIEAYCMALETIHTRYPEMRIVAISHDENMKSRFPQQITVIGTENGSKVVRG